MTSESKVSVHWSFWLISVVGLLWNVGGSLNYLMQTDLEFVSRLPETHRAIIDGRPIWATGGFAIGVFGGALGCLLLLFRKSLAMPLLIVSLLGIVATMIHTINVAVSKIDFNVAEIIIMVIMPLVVAAILLAYAKFAISKNWIG